MNTIETVVCLDKSRIQFSEYQKFKEQEQCLAKRIYELQSDLSREKSKNEKLIEELEEFQRENKQLREQIKDLESQLKDVIEDNDYYQKENEKMKNHTNCKFYHEWNSAIIMHKPLSDLSHCQGCKNFNKWELAE